MAGGREVTGEVTLIPKPEFREGAAYRLSGEERGGQVPGRGHGRALRQEQSSSVPGI